MNRYGRLQVLIKRVSNEFIEHNHVGSFAFLIKYPLPTSHEKYRP